MLFRSGHIFYDGIDITGESSAHIARRGVVRSFQISAVFPHLSVLENVRVALQRQLGTSYHFWKSERSLQRLNDRAHELLHSVDLESFASLTAVELSYGRKRALEFATTLAMDPKLMLLDEPTQGMGLEDVDRIRQLIKRVAADRTVLMVEHNMSVVSSIADTITVLQRGATLAEDGTTRTGSVLIINVPDLAAAEAWSKNEPFRRAGLFKSVKITRMRRGQWNPDAAPGSAEGH